MPEKKEKDKAKSLAKKAPSAALAFYKPTQEELATVKRYICKGATEAEIVVFLNECKMWQLNPFKKEIYLVKYSEYEPARSVIGFNSFLKRAERQKGLKGWKVWTEGKIKTEEFKACIKILREGWDEPFIHEVYWDEYAQRKKSGEFNKFWDKMPRTMLKKVVVKQGFAFCYPDELGGLPFIVEELPIEVETLPVQEVEVKEEPVEEPKEKEKIKVKKRAKEQPQEKKEEPEEEKPKEEEKEEKKEPEELTLDDLTLDEVIKKLDKKIEQATFDRKEFKAFLVEYQEGLPKKRKFVDLNEYQRFSFHCGNLEDLKLAILHFDYLTGEFVAWSKKKAEEAKEKAEEKEDDIPF